MVDGASRRAADGANAAVQQLRADHRQEPARDQLLPYDLEGPEQVALIRSAPHHLRSRRPKAAWFRDGARRLDDLHPSPLRGIHGRWGGQGGDGRVLKPGVSSASARQPPQHRTGAGPFGVVVEWAPSEAGKALFRCQICRRPGAMIRIWAPEAGAMGPRRTSWFAPTLRNRRATVSTVSALAHHRRLLRRGGDHWISTPENIKQAAIKAIRPATPNT